MPTEPLQGDGTSAVDASQAMLAILALLAADRDERVAEQPARRSEFVLADAGFATQEIAKLTGRKYEAVRSLLRRRAQSDKQNAEGQKT